MDHFFPDSSAILAPNKHILFSTSPVFLGAQNLIGWKLEITGQLNCSVDLYWVRKDSLNPKSYNSVFVRVLNKLMIFDHLEPESSFGEVSPYMQL